MTQAPSVSAKPDALENPSGEKPSGENPNKQTLDRELKPRIAVIGAGGAGGNAVNNMIKSQLEGVEFIACNTDAQALGQALAPEKIQLGVKITQGLGAGSSPEMGKAAAEEALEEIVAYLQNKNMVFITAGMGGGTGTGSAPVIARAAKDMGILTVGVVTKPFHFEGVHRMTTAERGIEALQEVVDTLIVIPNQNLFRIANEKTTFADAFNMADDVLYSGVRSVTDLMIMPGLINLDFADIRTVMGEMGKAMMGTGEAEGENRAMNAAEAAISNPLLDEVSMKGARGVLISITGGMDMTLFEVDESANRIRDEVDSDANIIFGSTFDEKLNGKIRVSVVATGIDAFEARPGMSFSEAVSAPTAPEEETETAEEILEETQDLPPEETQNLPRFEPQDSLQATQPFSVGDAPIPAYDELTGQPLQRPDTEAARPLSFFGRLRRSLSGESAPSPAPAPSKGERNLQPQSQHLRVRSAEQPLPSQTESEISEVPAVYRRGKKL